MRGARISIWGLALVFVASSLAASLAGGCDNFSSYKTAMPLKAGKVSMGDGIG